MRRFPILGVLLLIPALVFLGMTGCSDKKTPATKTTGADPKTTNNKGDGKTVKITAATDGTVAGVVKFDGEAPAIKLIVDEIKKNKDADACLAGQKANVWNVAEQTWLVDKKGGVANVVISLVPEAGKEYDIKADLLAKWKMKTDENDQPYCAYIPHVIAVFADVQPVVFKNTSAVSHSVKIVGGETNGNSEKVIAPKVGATEPRTFAYDRRPVPVMCALHGWMNSKVITFKHPYFAVTKADGSFEIGDVPVGETLRVFMWHESLDKAIDTGKTVTAAAGKKTTIDGLKISNK
jgi:hypothetical protein